jgi:hypothetical protein
VQNPPANGKRGPIAEETSLSLLVNEKKPGNINQMDAVDIIMPNWFAIAAIVKYFITKRSIRKSF